MTFLKTLWLLPCTPYCTDEAPSSLLHACAHTLHNHELRQVHSQKARAVLVCWCWAAGCAVAGRAIAGRAHAFWLNTEAGKCVLCAAPVCHSRNHVKPSSPNTTTGPHKDGLRLRARSGAVAGRAVAGRAHASRLGVAAEVAGLHAHARAAPRVPVLYVGRAAGVARSVEQRHALCGCVRLRRQAHSCSDTYPKPLTDGMSHRGQVGG